MVENNTKIMIDLDKEIQKLEELINQLRNSNEILKLNVQKKELLLKKLEFEQSL